MDEPPPRERRADALGDLSVLPDEFLCAALDLLAPPDLARLACVSSVMYILCNEEPLWMTQCLRVGGQLEYKGSWKKTTFCRQNLGSEIDESCRRTMQFDGFNSLFLYRRWYRCFTTLDAFCIDNGVLERKNDLTVEEFHSHYDGRKPILLTDLAKSWPAKNKWTFDQLLVKYGDVTFRISQRSSKKITMKFKDYVSYMKLQHDEDPLYIFDDKFGEAAPELLENYTVPHLFQEDWFDVLDDQRPPFRWLIIGPERSGANWHVDPALTSAWNTLLSGRKRWALYPPGRVPAGVTVHVNEEDGDVNIESPSSLQWWLDVYPLLADHDKPLECIQLPGETISVPSGWWHCVLNLEPTIAVTQNFVNTSNFEYVCLDMAPGHIHKGVSRAGLIAVEDKGFEALNNNVFSETNKLNYPDMTRKEKRLKVSESVKEPYRHDINWTARNGPSQVCKKLQELEFSYDVDFLAIFLVEERDHYNSIWSPGNCIGPRDLREWLHKLWIAKPTMRELIWKGACLSLNAEKWSACMAEICAQHHLPSPLDDEKHPVGTGSNPVFLISDYVIKIYVEGGLESSIHCLGTELQFYHLLQKVKSPLIDHVPGVLASGILLCENGCYQAHPWDGKGVPDVIAKSNLVKGDFGDDEFSFGVWSKKKFELHKTRIVPSRNTWPYIVIKRCEGDIFANVRNVLPRDDVLHLASFLGDQLRNIHLLPLPQFQVGLNSKIHEMSLTQGDYNDLAEDSGTPAANVSTEVTSICFRIPQDWELIITAMQDRRKDIKDRLTVWGAPIPDFLIEKVEEYIPPDPTMLLDLIKEDNGVFKVIGSPTWIHSDIMDDNVHMEQYNTDLSSDEIAVDARSTVNGTLDACNAKVNRRKWLPTHILDFSDLSIGDPLYDVIPIYLDIFKGDAHLLKQFLESYKLPLARGTSNHDVLSFRQVEQQQKFRRLSYRAMCYCILHEENILGAIFSLWKELKSAKTWEEVEEAVWGDLNNYQGSNHSYSK